MASCLLTLIALCVPRVLIFFIWLLTDWFSRGFETVVWPVLGFLFMPYTTLAYLAAMLRNDHSLSGWWVVLVVFAVLVDLSHWGGGQRAYHRRRIVVIGRK